MINRQRLQRKAKKIPVCPSPRPFCGVFNWNFIVAPAGIFDILIDYLLTNER
jgi:hypothetical protein